MKIIKSFESFLGIDFENDIHYKTGDMVKVINDDSKYFGYFGKVIAIADKSNPKYPETIVSLGNNPNPPREPQSFLPKDLLSFK